MEAVIIPSGHLDATKIKSAKINSERIPTAYEPMQKELKRIIGCANCEFHVTAYQVREQLKSSVMRNKHEKLTIACDEDGRYKQLPFNERASRMTGLDLIGTIVLFINPADAPEYDSEDSDFDNVGDERRENAVTFNLADANALLAEVVLLK